MKPEQFIREQGLDEAREVLVMAQGQAWADYYNILTESIGTAGRGFSEQLCKHNDHYVLLSDLKRLVESVEIIQFWHGIEWCKGLVEDYKEEPIHKESYGHRIIQAIRDHESIYGGGDE